MERKKTAPAQFGSNGNPGVGVLGLVGTRFKRFHALEILGFLG
jgi:hypothetical protein